MKRSVCFLCALAFALCLSACGVNGPQKGTDSAERPSADDKKLPDQGSIPSAPDAGGPVYCIVGGNLLGSWENGAWKSLNDVTGGYEPDSSGDFYFRDILSVPRYTLYSRNAKLGYSDFALITTHEGLGGFSDGDYTSLFAPFAKESSSSFWPESMEIPLSAKLKDEFGETKIPDYGYPLRFSYGEIDLAINSDADLNPFHKIEWEDEAGALDPDHDALREILSKNGIRGKTHFDQTATLDMDGDGKEEKLLFANTPRNDMGYPDISPETGGSYSVILMRRSDGTYETIYEQYVGYTEDVTAQFILSAKGIFDLNADGTPEICAVMGQWEGGYTFVLSKDQQNDWMTVLRANWGS